MCEPSVLPRKPHPPAHGLSLRICTASYSLKCALEKLEIKESEDEKAEAVRNAVAYLLEASNCRRLEKFSGDLVAS